MDQGITFNLLLYFWWNIIVVFSGFSNLFLDFLLNILDLRFTCDFWRILNNKGHFLVTWWFFFISVVCFDKVRLQISFWSHDVTQKIFKTQRKKKIKTFCLQHNVELLIFELELKHSKCQFIALWNGQYNTNSRVLNFVKLRSIKKLKTFKIDLKDVFF